jgi:hypothetical protein
MPNWSGLENGCPTKVCTGISHRQNWEKLVNWITKLTKKILYGWRKNGKKVVFVTFLSHFQSLWPIRILTQRTPCLQFSYVKPWGWLWHYIIPKPVIDVIDQPPFWFSQLAWVLNVYFLLYSRLLYGMHWTTMPIQMPSSWPRGFMQRVSLKRGVFRSIHRVFPSTCSSCLSGAVHSTLISAGCIVHNWQSCNCDSNSQNDWHFQLIIN